MGMESNCTLTGADMKENSGLGKSRGKGNLYGRMGQYILANLRMDLCKGKVFTDCRTDRYTKESLERIRGTVEESILHPWELILADIERIKKKEQASLCGETGRCSREPSTMGNQTVQDH